MINDFPQQWVNLKAVKVLTARSPKEAQQLRQLGYMPNWPRRSPLGYEYCDVGWRAGLTLEDGRWAPEPDHFCSAVGRNAVGSDLPGFAFRLCDEHFAIVNRAGMITKPYIGKEGFEKSAGWSPP